MMDPLDEPLEDDDTLFAMAHQDTNDNEAYDFPATDGQADGPYVAAGGPVMDPLDVMAVTDETDESDDGMDESDDGMDESDDGMDESDGEMNESDDGMNESEDSDDGDGMDSTESDGDDDTDEAVAGDGGSDGAGDEDGAGFGLVVVFVAIAVGGLYALHRRS
ncbi:hypothetical protein BRC65_02105 [Halobacteriales archaeon QH_2_65_14]|nr:MAG: hypothetical protein BRC65_02105 [Halobacteriales archaeon QH_2_65_14]